MIGREKETEWKRNEGGGWVIGKTIVWMNAWRKKEKDRRGQTDAREKEMWRKKMNRGNYIASGKDKEWATKKNKAMKHDYIGDL